MPRFCLVPTIPKILNTTSLLQSEMPRVVHDTGECCRPGCRKDGTRSVPTKLFRGSGGKVCKACYTWMRRHFQLEPNGKHVRCAQHGVLPRCAQLLKDFEAAGVYPALMIVHTQGNLVLPSSRVGSHDRTGTESSSSAAAALPALATAHAPLRRSGRQRKTSKVVSYADASSDSEDEYEDGDDDDDYDDGDESMGADSEVPCTPPPQAQSRPGRPREVAPHPRAHPPQHSYGARKKFPTVDFDGLSDDEDGGSGIREADPPASSSVTSAASSISARSGPPLNLSATAHSDGLVCTTQSPGFLDDWAYAASTPKVAEGDVDTMSWSCAYLPACDSPVAEDDDGDLRMSADFADLGGPGYLEFNMLANAEPCAAAVATDRRLFPSSYVPRSRSLRRPQAPRSDLSFSDVAYETSFA